MYVTSQPMTNKSLRDRFRLPEHKAQVVSQLIAAAQAAGKLKLPDGEPDSRRYARYIPFWA